MKILLIVLAVFFASTVEAKFFFLANDSMVTNCIVSQFDKPSDIKAKLEESGQQCTYVDDNHGALIFTCEGSATNMYFFADDLESCNSIRANIVTMLGHE